MPYSSYSPSQVFTQAMFDFDSEGWVNFRLTGAIRVSVSDGFTNTEYNQGRVIDTDFTLSPLSAEVDWSTSRLQNLKDTLKVLSNFANLPFSSVVDCDTGGWNNHWVASPADVGNASDINITFMNCDDPNLLGISSASTDLFGCEGSRGDVLINCTGSAFASNQNWFAETSKSRQVLMHEILHSVGLSHPHPYDAPDTVKDDFSALQNAYGSGTGTTGSGNDTIVAGKIGYRTYHDLDYTDFLVA